jgi:hypothetical protein
MMAIGWFVLGGAGWSVSEYLIHRHVGHGPKRARPRTLLGRLTPAGLAAEFNAEHLAHHTTPTYFAPTSHKIAAAAAAIPALAGALTPLLGLRRAGSFALGFAVVYGAYEIVHRRIHTHPPRGRYGRWVRRHHLLHHHRTPRANHGVTSPLWDLAFRTERPLERLRVPRQVAPVWLTDPATGAVRHEHAEDYEIWPARGRGEAAVASAP